MTSTFTYRLITLEEAVQFGTPSWMIANCIQWTRNEIAYTKREERREALVELLQRQKRLHKLLKRREEGNGV